MNSSTQEDVYDKLKKDRHVNAATGDSFYSSNGTSTCEVTSSDDDVKQQRGGGSPKVNAVVPDLDIASRSA